MFSIIIMTLLLIIMVQKKNWIVKQKILFRRL